MIWGDELRCEIHEKGGVLALALVDTEVESNIDTVVIYFTVYPFSLICGVLSLSILKALCIVFLSSGL